MARHGHRHDHVEARSIRHMEVQAGTLRAACKLSHHPRAGVVASARGTNISATQKFKKRLTLYGYTCARALSLLRFQNSRCSGLARPVSRLLVAGRWTG